MTPIAEATPTPAPDAVAEVQRPFLMAETLTEGQPPHLQHCVCRLPDNVDVARLRRAIGLLNSVHDALRTHFSRGAQRHLYARHVQAHGGLELEERPSAETAAALLQRLRQEDGLEELRPPISTFGPAPLAHATLLYTADGRKLLILSVHHLIFDGMAGATYCRQLVELYTQADPERGAAALSERVPPYQRFVQQQHEQLFGAGRAPLHAFWREYLRGLEIDRTPVLPQSLAAPPAHRLHFTLAAAHVLRLRCFADEHGLTPHLVLMACLQWAAHRRERQPDMLTLTPTKNRPREFAECLGCFMNPVVVRQRINPAASLGDALVALRGAVASAYRHAALPISHVLRELCPELLAAHVPLWRSRFSIQVPAADFPLPPGLPFELHVLPQSRTAGKGVALEMIGDGHDLLGWFLANQGVGDAAGELARFLWFVDQVIERPGLALGRALETAP